MSERIVKRDPAAIAKVAADLTVKVLREAILAKGEAIWVLAGGTAPMMAYESLAERHLHSLDWSRVTLLIGDERCVPVDHVDANWQHIHKALISRLPFAPANLLRPTAEDGPEAAAPAYEAVLRHLTLNDAGTPQFDLFWLGMGEDGHTLSLFSENEAHNHSEALVIPVHDSPKPPPERISLTFRAMQATKHCMILATGAGKAPVLRKIAAGDRSLPIMQAAETVEHGGGTVQWLLDDAAASGTQPGSWRAR